MRIARIAVMGLALGLAACAGLENGISYSYVDAAYSPTEFGYAASSGFIPTIIKGNPFAQPKAALDASVSRTMEESHFGPPVKFVTDQTQNATSYQVLIEFDAPISQGAPALCATRGNLPDPPRGTGVVHVVAAFCSSGEVRTYAVGTIPRPAGPDDPVFTAFVGQLALTLFPPNNPQQENDRPEVPLL